MVSNMASKMEWKQYAIDKTEMRTIVALANSEIGILADPSITPHLARALMTADGVVPEDNLFSCGIMAARDEV